MLNIIREGARSWVSQIFIWFIAITFVGAAFLVWGDARPSGGGVAIVGDREITEREYRVALDQVETRLRNQFGASVDPALLKTLNAPKIALDSLINQSLQELAAIDAGFAVPDEELTSAIQGAAEFMVDGQFSNSRYFELLSLNRISPSEFEHDFRKELLISKLRRSIERVAFVTDAEAYVRYQYENQPIIVRYVKVRTKDLEDKVAVTDESLLAWYKERKKGFLEPEERSFRMLTASSESFEAIVEITDTDLLSYYEQNISEFEVEESVRASHIIIQTASDANPDETATAKEKIDKAYARVKAGEEFELIAREMSEGPTASKGGDLGSFSRGMMVPEFEQVVFGLAIGEISEPFHTSFGWHIARTVERVSGETPKLAQVRDEVTKKVRNKKAKELAKISMEKISATVGPESFAAVTDENPQIKVNSYTIKFGKIDTTLDYPRAAEEVVFSMKEKEVSRPFEVVGGYSLVMVDKITLPYAPPLDKVRTRVEARFRAEEASKLADEVALKIERSVNEGADIEKVAVAEGFSAAMTKQFARETFLDPAKVKDDGMLMEAFELADDEAKSIPYQGDYLVIMVASRLEADKEGAKEKLPQIRQSLKEGKKIRVYGEYVAALRQKAEEAGEVEILVDLQ